MGEEWRGRGEGKGGRGVRERSGRVRGGVEGRNDCSIATDVTNPATQNTFIDQNSRAKLVCLNQLLQCDKPTDLNLEAHPLTP